MVSRLSAMTILIVAVMRPAGSGCDQMNPREDKSAHAMRAGVLSDGLENGLLPSRTDTTFEDGPAAGYA